MTRSRPTAGERGGAASARPLLWLVPALAVAFGLEIHGLADLRLFSDSAASVYNAGRPLLRIVPERLVDGHPPLYFLLLHFWMSLGGKSELATRLLSVFFAIGAAAAAYPAGRLLGGPRAGLAAMTLVAFSPDLFYFSRIVRMYSALACLALVASWACWQAMHRPSTARLTWYALAALLAAYDHYYALLFLTAQGAWWLIGCLRKRYAWRPFFVANGAIVLLYIPWLAYAARSQVAATAPVVERARAVHGPIDFLQQIWLPFSVGDALDRNFAHWLTLPLGVVFLACIALVVRRGMKLPGAGQLLLSGSLGALILSFGAVSVLQGAAQPRYLLVALPPLLCLAAWLGFAVRKAAAPLFVLGAVVVLGLDGYGIARTYQVQAQMSEPDAVQVSETLERLGQPGDLAVYHAFWEAGFFQSHALGSPVSVMSLDNLDQANPESQLSGYRRVWLSMYGSRPRDPRYPLEAWLDGHWAKVGQWQFGPNRLQLYVHPDTDLGSLDGELGLHGPGSQIQVTGCAISAGSVKAGEALSVTLRLRAAAPTQRRLTLFLHLVDSGGNRIAGVDAEPQEGLRPTTTWRPGQDVIDSRGFILPPDTLPGTYQLELGGYDTLNNAQPLEVLAGPRGPEGHLLLGSVQVLPTTSSETQPNHPLQALFGSGLQLLGYDLDIDPYTVQSKQVIDATLGEDIVLEHQRLAYRPGEDVNLTLYFDRNATAPDTVLTVQLIGADGRSQARHDSPLVWGPLPSSRWPANARAVVRAAIALPKTLQPGDYRLGVSLRRQDSGETLPVGGHDRIDLQTVAVRA